MEFAGEVAAIGSEVPGDIAVGQRVMASGAGGFAEYAVADWGRVAPIPGQIALVPLPRSTGTVFRLFLPFDGVPRGPVAVPSPRQIEPVAAA